MALPIFVTKHIRRLFCLGDQLERSASKVVHFRGVNLKIETVDVGHEPQNFTSRAVGFTPLALTNNACKALFEILGGFTSYPLGLFVCLWLPFLFLGMEVRHAVNLIEIRLEERWQPISNQSLVTGSPTTNKADCHWWVPKSCLFTTCWVSNFTIVIP